jgi:hypothetical protein
VANESARPNVVSMLKWPLLLLVISLISSGCMLAAAYLYMENEKRSNEASQRLISDAQARMSNANREVEALKNSIDKFNSLRKIGAFSQENRLAWIERTLLIQKQHNIQSLEFDLGARKKPTLQGNRNYSALGVYASPISFKFQALHEEEALAFLDASNQSPGGLFPVESCSFTRISKAPLSNPAPRIEAECKALWVTLEDKRASAPGKTN